MKTNKYFLAFLSSVISLALSHVAFSGDFDYYSQPDLYRGYSSAFTEERANYAENKITILNSSIFPMKVTAEAQGSPQSVGIAPKSQGVIQLKSNTAEGDIMVAVVIEMKDVAPVKFSFNKRGHGKNQHTYQEGRSTKIGTLFYDFNIYLTTGVEPGSSKFNGKDYSYIAKYGITIKVSARDLGPSGQLMKNLTPKSSK